MTPVRLLPGILATGFVAGAVPGAAVLLAGRAQAASQRSAAA